MPENLDLFVDIYETLIDQSPNNIASPFCVVLRFTAALINDLLIYLSTVP